MPILFTGKLYTKKDLEEALQPMKKRKIDEAKATAGAPSNV